ERCATRLPAPTKSSQCLRRRTPRAYGARAPRSRLATTIIRRAVWPRPSAGIKAQNDTLLREYALYWTALAQRALGRTADAYKVLQSIQHDYPNATMREQ